MTTIEEVLGSKKSAIIGKIVDELAPESDIKIRITRDRYSSRLVPQFVIKANGKTKTQQLDFRGIELNTPVNQVLTWIEDYLLEGGEEGLSVLPIESKAKSPSKTKAKKPEHPLIAEKRRELSQLKKRKYKTAGDEYAIELWEKRLAADPAKWKPGMGVKWKVTRDQWNTGFQIAEVYPETKQALIVQIADTGLTRSGADDPIDRSGELVYLGDLRRDKRYDADVRGTTSGVNEKTPPADLPQLWQIDGLVILGNRFPNPTFITAWDEEIGEQIGTLRLNEKQIKGEEWLSVAEVSVDRRYRRQGIGRAMYKAALASIQEPFAGLISYSPDRDKKLNNLYRRLGASTHPVSEDYEIIRRQSPMIGRRLL